AEQCARDGRVDTDAAAVEIALVGADDPIRMLVASVIFERDPCAKEYAARIGRRLADDDDLLEPPRQEAPAPIGLAEAALAMDAHGIVRAIALRGGVRDLLGHAWSLHRP